MRELTSGDILGMACDFSAVPCKTTLGGGGVVYIKKLTAGERGILEHAMMSGKDFDARCSRARMLVACICGKDGKPLFTDDHIDKLSNLPAADVEPLFDACRNVNKWNPADLKELLDFFEKTPPQDSSSS